MEKLIAFLNNIHRNKISILLSILLFSSLITFLTNLLFNFESIKDFIENKFYFTLFGLTIYGIWIAVIYFLLKKGQNKLDDFGISKRSILEGLLAGFYLIFIANLIFSMFSLLDSGNIVLSDDYRSWLLTFTKLCLFSFNILVGAFIEELIFRGYLIPQFFHFFKSKINSNGVSLVIAIVIAQIVFSLFHIPMKIYRYDIPIWTLLPDLIQLFISGIAFSILYLRTRNLVFVTIVHALLNFPISFVESKISFYVPCIIIVLIILLFKKRLFQAT